MSTPRVLFLDVKLPRPDRDAASVRSAQLLEYLSARANVDFAALTDFGLPPEPGRETAALGARLIAAGEPEAIRDHLRRHGRDYQVILCAWCRTAAHFMSDARRAAPKAGLVFDTVDVNHVREYRHAQVTRNARRLRAALEFRHQEAAAMALADCTVAITESDRAVLAVLAPGARIAIAGIWIDPAQDPAPDPTPTILFIGHYQAEPNRDAALVLAGEVMPRVLAHVPNAVLELAGSDPGAELTALAGPRVRVPGWEADLRPRLVKARVFAAPLRFGSGLKGKVLQAIAHRVPLVASAIAVEGTGLLAGRDYLPADSPAECAENAVRVLRDPKIGPRLAENAAGVLRERFSREVIRRQFDAVFSPFLRR